MKECHLDSLDTFNPSAWVRFSANFGLYFTNFFPDRRMRKEKKEERRKKMGQWLDVAGQCYTL
jgi:hypothetical protein